jgi:hypothetical protein
LSPAAGFLVQLLLVTQIDARRPCLAYNDIRSGELTKKGALRALGYDSHPQVHDVVNAGALTSDRGLHGRVQPVVGDREHWSWLAIGRRTNRILASKSLNVLLRRARTGPRGVRRQHVEVNEPAGRWCIVRGRMRVYASGDLIDGHQATSGSW